MQTKRERAVLTVLESFEGATTVTAYKRAMRQAGKLDTLDQFAMVDAARSAKRRVLEESINRVVAL